jgi:hypothetical protein
MKKEGRSVEIELNIAAKRTHLWRAAYFIRYRGVEKIYFWQCVYQ